MLVLSLFPQQFFMTLILNINFNYVHCQSKEAINDATVPVFVHVIIIFVASTVMIPTCLFAPVNGFVATRGENPNAIEVDV